MKVLSLFDGISCGQLALQRAGVHVDTYYASEI
jgi:DNA (cytosine-5)-methyltransferase 3A